jgi:hypothetical protein
MDTLTVEDRRTGRVAIIRPPVGGQHAARPARRTERCHHLSTTLDGLAQDMTKADLTPWAPPSTSSPPPAGPADAPQPIGQPRLALASPELRLTIRHDSSTAWKSLAGISFSSDTRASGHCGYALPWKNQLLPLSARISP